MILYFAYFLYLIVNTDIFKLQFKDPLRLKPTKVSGQCEYIVLNPDYVQR